MHVVYICSFYAHNEVPCQTLYLGVGGGLILILYRSPIQTNINFFGETVWSDSMPFT